MIKQNIKLAADSVVLSQHGDDTQIFLVRRKNDPYKDMWALPGGFVEDGETTMEAAIRELHEETGMKLEYMKQFHVFDKPDRDPRQRTVSITHYAFVNAKDHSVKGSDDATEAKWMNIEDITELAFDHKEIVAYALQQLSLTK